MKKTNKNTIIESIKKGMFTFISEVLWFVFLPC